MIEVMVEVFARLLNKSEAHSIYLIHLIYFRTAFKNRAVSPERARHKKFLVLRSEFFVQKNININSYLLVRNCRFCGRNFRPRAGHCKSIYGKR